MKTETQFELESRGWKVYGDDAVKVRGGHMMQIRDSGRRLNLTSTAKPGNLEFARDRKGAIDADLMAQDIVRAKERV